MYAQTGGRFLSLPSILWNFQRTLSLIIINAEFAQIFGYHFWQKNDFEFTTVFHLVLNIFRNSTKHPPSSIISDRIMNIKQSRNSLSHSFAYNHFTRIHGNSLKIRINSSVCNSSALYRFKVFHKYHTKMKAFLVLCAVICVAVNKNIFSFSVLIKFPHT